MPANLTRIAPLAGSIALLLLASSAARAWQEETGGDGPPIIPETEVEAEGTPPANADPTTNGSPQVLPTILNTNIFTSPAVDGYRADSATTGTLFDVPQLELPATVNVLPHDLLRDQQVLNFDQAFRNVPGAIAVGDGLFQDRLFLRGLEVRTRDFRKNGFLDPTFTPRDFANIQRVEILKGPASVLYGSAAPSGTVNFITKKPMNDFFNTFNYQFGGFETSRFQVDLNGWASANGNLMYRFNGAYENSGSFRDFGFTERHILAPALRWLITPYTVLTWEAEMVENRRRGDRGVPAIGGNALALPPQRYVGEPANDFLYTEDYRTSLQLYHEFANDWTLYVGASTVFYEFPASQSFAVAPLPALGPTTFLRLRQNDQDQENSTSLIANVAGDASLGLFNHKLLFGTEQVYYDSESRFSGGLLAPIDAANPVYLNPPPGPFISAAGGFDSQFPVFRQIRHGYYVQDLLEINEFVQVLGGVRFDEVDLDFERTVGPALVRTEQRFSRTTPRVGIVYQPIPDLLSTYFSYGRSFNPPGGGGFGFTGQARQPELGESYEAGVKTLLLEDLSLYAAGYYVARKNVPFATFTLAGPQFFQVGRERSQGAEVELIGRVTDRWSLISGYGYTDTRLTDDANPAIVGQRQRNVPYNQASMWSRYNLLDDGRQTFGTALGYVYQGERTANLAANVMLPSYTRWDGGLYYNYGRLEALVFLENLFDIHYATSSINEFTIFPGAPFNARAQVGLTY